MNSINLTKNHVQPVGSLRTIVSPQYGTYYMRCIANVCNFPSGVTDQDKTQMLDMIRLIKECSVYLFTLDSETEVSAYSSIYIALDEDNKKWAAENPDCVYLRLIGKKKAPFPIGTAKKTFDRIIAKIPTLYILP